MKRLAQTGEEPEGEEAQPRRSWAEAAPDIVTAVVGSAMVVFALWGFWVAAGVARPSGNPNPIVARAEHNLIAAKFILTWLVLFAPFFVLGSAILFSTFRKHERAARILGILGSINLITPFWLGQSRYARMAQQFHGYEMDRPAPESLAAHRPLDEETVRKVDHAGYLAARLLGVLVGALLAGGGVAGLTMSWLDVHSPPASYSVWYDLASLRLYSLPFLTLCGLAVLLGMVVLRDTFRPEERAWMAPLRLFGVIVGLKVVAEMLRRDSAQKPGAKTLPATPRKALGPGPDAGRDREAP